MRHTPKLPDLIADESRSAQDGFGQGKWIATTAAEPRPSIPPLHVKHPIQLKSFELGAVGMLLLSLPELSLHMNWSSTTNLSLSSLNEALEACIDMWLSRKPCPKEVDWAHYGSQELISIRIYMSDPRLGDRHALALLISESWVQWGIL